jgi:hypothetical protein
VLTDTRVIRIAKLFATAHARLEAKLAHSSHQVPCPPSSLCR